MSANRVEKLVYWHPRFNGYITVENFTIHPDNKKGKEAEADLLCVRFPFVKDYAQRSKKDTPEQLLNWTLQKE